ncbi:hypothetical protein WJX77_003412 [Trebouxia sp. C0004]
MYRLPAYHYIASLGVETLAHPPALLKQQRSRVVSMCSRPALSLAIHNVDPATAQGPGNKAGRFYHVKHSSSTRTSDPSLATSHSTIYSQSLPANHQKPERPTLLKDILNAAAQMAMVNFDNHVATNFFSRTRRWIRLQLGQKMHFANMEGRREKSWFSLPCRAATRQDGSIWDLLPVYTSLSC